jgi:hypothetical protein
MKRARPLLTTPSIRFDDQFRTIVTARRFCAQLASSEPKAIGRSLP